jgi:hypothetical protein
MSALAPKIEASLVEAFKKLPNDDSQSYSADAAIVAHVLLRYHGDQAASVLELAALLAKGASSE